MAERYWLDTCIWRDFYENRFSKAGNPLGEYATNAFMKTLRKGNKILFSESLIRELHEKSQGLFCVLKIRRSKKVPVKLCPLGQSMALSADFYDIKIMIRMKSTKCLTFFL